ncbi:hypothetical protein [Parasedimentitalea huanghaiensis]|uniref:Uncharacterized protein n=1 Tax=Parasedimentitalea huanghaiensis TaxID=2682100 RepID=A0A6L6WM53_9RHOB|nr:hypothetical protein [Zongyanglinia huanghaiensis]MVO18571.1 hypothetical protein [Zongyanglinia huanghaiensis]
MVVGILALAVIFGGTAGIVALVAGHTLFTALLIYTGFGCFSVLLIASLIVADCALRSSRLGSPN